jgi:hypothetical protein
MVKKNLPCETCITKAICLNKKEINCIILATYLKIRLIDYNVRYVRYNYIINKYKLRIEVTSNNNITVWHGEYPTFSTTTIPVELKFLYKTVQKMNMKFTDRKIFKWIKKLFRVNTV